MGHSFAQSEPGACLPFTRQIRPRGFTFRRMLTRLPGTAMTVNGWNYTKKRDKSMCGRIAVEMNRRGNAPPFGLSGPHKATDSRSSRRALTQHWA
jgi:hypothetical protein